MSTVLRGTDNFDTGIEYGVGGDGYQWVQMNDGNPENDRASGVTYANTTGKTLYLSIYLAGENERIYSDGLEVAFQYSTYTQNLHAIIKAGSTYGVTSGATIYNWYELRYTGGTV